MTNSERRMRGILTKEEMRDGLRNKPCPICESIEGCDHPLSERLRASFDTDYRDRLRAEDPLWQLQQAKRAARAAANHAS